jgi:hypothetical protein
VAPRLSVYQLFFTKNFMTSLYNILLFATKNEEKKFLIFMFALDFHNFVLRNVAKVL